MSAPAIVGVGMTPFGKHLDKSLKTLAGFAIGEALEDAGLEPTDIDMAFVANSMGAITVGQVSIVGQAILGAQGFGGIPVFNIDNACASSSSAVYLAAMALRAGQAQRVLVVGVEKLYNKDRSLAFRALNGAADIDFVASVDVDPDRESVFTKAVYPARLKAYATRWGLKPETLAQISVKNREHAAHNPLAQYRETLSVADVLGSRTIVEPLTALMCSPIGDGATAAVLTTAPAASGRESRPVWLAGTAVGMGGPPGTQSASTISRLARDAYTQAGIEPSQVDVAELHDSTAFTELQAYEELGLCEQGSGARIVEARDTALGGRLPVNTSGGLESRGHPVAATGLAQIHELVLQLRNEAADRQVADARWALAENAGGFAHGDSAAVAITVLSAAPPH